MASDQASPPNDDTVLRVLEMQYQASQQGFLMMWTVYDHPADYPDCFVTRAHLVGNGDQVATAHVIRGQTLQQLRSVLRTAGLTPIARSPDDDLKIVETWL